MIAETKLAIEDQPRMLIKEPLEVECRKFYVVYANIETHGHMGSCPRCASFILDGKAAKPRKDELRERVGRITMRPEINSNDVGVFGIDYQIRIRFSSLRIFFCTIRFFGVFKVQSHTMCGRTCACAVACLCTQNSISIVVVSLTIHDNILVNIYVCKRCSKTHETFVEGHKHTCAHTRNFSYTYTFTHSCSYTYTYT